MTEDKKTLTENELKDIAGGFVIPSEIWFKCNACGTKWRTNNSRCSKCPYCDSTDIERD